VEKRGRKIERDDGGKVGREGGIKSRHTP